MISAQLSALSHPQRRSYVNLKVECICCGRGINIALVNPTNWSLHNNSRTLYVCSQASILPALLNCLTYSFCVLFPIILVQIRGLHIRRTRGIGIVEQGLDTGQYRSNIVGG
jgi:hypothetical protein